ncbi:Ca2+-modulated nonselective cation channel polycystin [Teratosphaeria destructans]|uniref:Ca2+-modulated nonselective cation channel polycystin n=1 Tax=Teratosphaeria destructans TaxID=418781 RepID=A0A9W7W750_9PEZI|nr:Ca2+-modulated nonselective cation channel polycystin [Teratosphaeria destructans]
MSASNATPNSNQSKRTLRPILGKSKPDLAINTTFARHKGGTPRQIFPYESRTQELSFISLASVKALQKGKKDDAKQQLKERLQLRPSAQRQVTVQPSFAEQHGHAAQASFQAPPLHRRIKGLRPSPLDLGHDVSPSDRVIPIGLSVPVSSARKGSGGSEASSLARQRSARRGEDAQTPTIVITPAKEDFEFVDSDFSGHRPTSSIYSRYTNYAPRTANAGDTPPVPPLPFCVARSTTQRSACKTSEEHSEPEDSQAQSKRLTSQSHLPTPLRSKGWWNVVTSPFSAGSKSSAFFWRSPSLPEEDEDRAPILDDASSMGECDQHAGFIFTNRALDDDELRTALPQNTGTDRPPVPQRSKTAPCFLASGATTVNIYRVPSHGYAAAYYDASRHFPSVIINTSQRGDLEDLEGWSPSQSVAQSENDGALDGTPSQSKRGLAADYYDPNKDFSTPTLLQRENRLSDEISASWSPSQSVACPDRESGTSKTATPAGTNRAPSIDAASEAVEDKSRATTAGTYDEDGPFADSHQSFKPNVPKDGLCATRTSHVIPAATGINVFSTPSQEELEYTSPPRPMQARDNTEQTMASCFSPLSASPVVEDAHMATFVGPHPSQGELRQVEVTPYRLSTPPDRGLAAATMASRDVTRNEATENALCRPAMHERTASNESFGLGIRGADDEKAQTAEIVPVWQDHGFFKTAGRRVDRELGAQRPGPPWHKRFRLMLILGGACLLIIWIVLMVMFVAIKSKGGMPVEAEWLNLTGYPPLPTGVSTIIRPSKVSEVDGCVNAPQLWSCDWPLAEDQSNYRFEIRFRNHTVPKNETQLAKRGTYTAHPSAPSDDDQIFTGRYTDNVTSPYDGEQTPFYLSLLNASALTTTSILASSLERRGDPYPYPTSDNSSSSSVSSASSAEGPMSIPSPRLTADGKPSAAELYPLAVAQPLKLYNRGQDDEHYGFYTYFDRTIYVSKSSSNASDGSWLGSSISSNVALKDATAVCTLSQSRLHIQMWTKKSAVASLDSVVPLKGLPAINSTANNMTAPGSFPYSVTISLDRHGGSAREKGVYCYGISEGQKVDKDLKTWIDEDRAFGGVLVNPAAVPSSSGTAVMKRRTAIDSYEGIDGGTGGCSCEWQNWR